MVGTPRSRCLPFSKQWRVVEEISNTFKGIRPLIAWFIVTMSLERLNHDILLYMLSYADTESLLSLAQLSLTLCCLIKRFFLSRWREELSTFFYHRQKLGCGCDTSTSSFLDLQHSAKFSLTQCNGRTVTLTFTVLRRMRYPA